MKKTISIILTCVLLLSVFAFAGCAAGGGVAGTYTYTFPGMFGDETMAFELADDGTCKMNLPGNEMLTDIYVGTYVADGNTITVTGLTNADAASMFVHPGLWDFINAETGDCVIVIDTEAGTFTPAE